MEKTKLPPHGLLFILFSIFNCFQKMLPECGSWFWGSSSDISGFAQAKGRRVQDVAIRLMKGFKFGWIKIVSLSFGQIKLSGRVAEGGLRQTAVWKTKGHPYLLILPHPQMCSCIPLQIWGAQSPPCDFGRGDQRSLPSCASMEMGSLRTPFPAVCGLSASRSARFLHTEIRFSLSVPLTHFRLFEGTAELPGGCGSAFGGHGRAVELSGRNGSSTPKTHGRRLVWEVQPPLVCSPVFGRMFFSLNCCLGRGLFWLGCFFFFSF